MQFAMPICQACARLGPRLDGGEGLVCAAFPDGIPDAIYEGGFDHRQPFRGDKGIRFVLADGAEALLAAYEATLEEFPTDT